LFGVVTALSASTWSNRYQLAQAGVTHHPASPRWQQQMGQILWEAYLTNADPVQRATLYEATRNHLLEAARLSSFEAPGNWLTVLQIDSTDGHAPDPRLLEALTAQLPHRPVAPLTFTSFVHLLRCLTGSECQTPIANIEALLAGFLVNPKLTAKNRAQLLAAAANYALNRVSVAQALEYALAATQADPVGLQHQINLASVLIRAGQMDAARTALDHVREQDQRGAYQAQRESLERQISPPAQ
jgi:hypothetical protein